MLQGFIRSARPFLRSRPPHYISSKLSPHRLKLRFCFSQEATKPALAKLYEGVNFADIDSILAQISKLSNEENRLGLKLLLKNIQEGRLPSQTLLKQVFIDQTKKYPSIYIDAKLVLMTKLSAEMSELLQRNQLTKQTIEQYLSMISVQYRESSQQLKNVAENQRYIFSIMLNKIKFYALYRYLSIFGEGQQKKEGLADCKAAYQTMIQSLTVNLQSIADIIREGDESKMTFNRSLVEQLVNVLAEFTEFYFEIVKQLFKINAEREEFDQDIRQAKDHAQQTISLFESIVGKNRVSINYVIMAEITSKATYQLSKLQLPEKDKQTHLKALNLEYAYALNKNCDQILSKLAMHSQKEQLSLGQLYQIGLTLLRITMKTCELQLMNLEEAIGKIENTASRFLGTISDQQHKKELKEVTDTYLAEFQKKVKAPIEQLSKEEVKKG